MENEKNTQNTPAVIRNSIRLVRDFIRTSAAEPQLLDMHMVAIAEHLQHLQHQLAKQEEETTKLKNEMLELAQEVEWSSLMIQRIVRPEDYTGFNLDSEKQ